MERNMYGFKRIRETKITDRSRNIILINIMIICLLACTSLNVYQYFRYGIYKQIDISDAAIFDSDLYVWSIDHMKEKYDIYQIAGWIARRDEDIRTHNIQLVVVNEDGSSYLIPTEMVQRENGNEEEYDYSASGFRTSVNKKYVQSKDSKIYVLYQNNERYEIVDISTTFKSLG